MGQGSLIPHAGDYDIEEFFDDETGDYMPVLLAVACPTCGSQEQPLPSATVMQSGWRWVGVSYKEPFVDYEATCNHGHPFRFTTHIPQ
jgi:hypothetical protein